MARGTAARQGVAAKLVTAVQGDPAAHLVLSGSCAVGLSHCATARPPPSRQRHPYVCRAELMIPLRSYNCCGSRNGEGIWKGMLMRGLPGLRLRPTSSCRSLSRNGVVAPTRAPSSKPCSGCGGGVSG